ncbi:MAG TPA: hypothetical protein VF176_00365 [Solirubrobacterales bacterium]
MDILRNLFGSVTSGIVRLAVTAGVLALVYLFLVKPVLETTNNAIEKSGIGEISKSFEDVSVQVQRQIKRSLKTTQRRGGNPQRLIHCVERADGNARRIKRCTAKY